MENLKQYTLEELLKGICNKVEDRSYTLKEFLITSFNCHILYCRKTSKGYTINLGTSLNKEQLKVLKERIGENIKILSVNNEHPYTSYKDYGQNVRFECIIKTTKLPSKIMV